ncbi:NAD(P)/FAD-dependent oxidoreductase [Vulcanisaeta distributa]|uniref:FAD-dependent pyridine nucleotide-disulfide oxidoreductase n=1 Tax=Vulcanisaeta distributa (strain DSM 14429 / JCM 11212 / NBRC 100878 / IC-017) TaxID=572478 RepID=E1QPH7_VULDI|nr:FAD/NAD(P)-binding oxidoreductase [Vulcanisaeta distributa]ADN51465.1 FAD-dependent pyridine nucleotide-disulfide oxidoreductase [Vulcanisaeta distributa DSM 14429]
MKRIAIMGGNFSGIVVANKLAKRLRWSVAKGDVEIALFDRSPKYLIHAMLPLITFGSMSERYAVGDKAELLDSRIKYFFGKSGEVVNVDLANRTLTLADGSKYSYDYLVIASGADYVPEEVPGLLKDYHTYYTLEGALELRNILQGFNKGTIVELFVEPPIKCPIAPLKFGLMLDDYLRDRGVRGNVDVMLLYPTDHLHAQPEVNKLGKILLEERGVKYIFNFSVSEIRPEEKVVISDKGEKIKYDLLITIPPHRGAKAIRDSGIGDPYGFVPCDRYTLQYRKGKTKYDEVYVIGDATALEVAKAASVAHYQSDVVVENLVHDIAGEGSQVRYKGETICPMLTDLYTQHGRGRAWLPWWDYKVNELTFITTRFGWWFIRAFYLSLPLTMRGLA